MEISSEPSTNRPRPRIAIPQPALDKEYSEKTLGHYVRAIQLSGGEAVEVPLSSSPAEVARTISTCVAILLPGSPADLDPEKYGRQPSPECHSKDAAREAVDELLLQDAFNLRKPILGICYGMQALNVWLSGALIQDLEKAGVSMAREHSGKGANHVIEVLADSRLGEILAAASDWEDGSPGSQSSNQAYRLAVNSSHHQAVEEPGDRVQVVARCVADGVIEAVEGRRLGGSDQLVLGVQWHPERSYEESLASRLLFEAFVRAAADWRPHPIQDSVAP